MADDPIAELGGLFERDGTRFVPTQLARGPWSPKALHGGAPAALFATEVGLRQLTQAAIDKQR